MSDIPCPLAEAAKRYGAEPALIVQNQTITYEQYDRLVTIAARGLQKSGVTAKARVAIVAENSAEYAILMMAFFRLRTVACPISPRFPERAIFEYLKKIKCDRVIDPSNLLLTDRTQQIPKLNTDEILKFTDEGWMSKSTWSVSLERDATIIHTSGTTAQPKAVLLSYDNHFYNAVGSNRNITLEPGDRWLLSLPLYHVGGLAVLFRTMLGGGAVVIPDNRKDLTDAVRRHRVTHLSLVPTQLHRLLKTPSLSHNMKQLKAVLVGGSAIPEPL
ncbi:MAG: AMP-binding protein, partial [Candidatus Zixiibacteriota bacterium]